MSGIGLRDAQMELAHYLRSPSVALAPAGVEQRRLDVYERLVFNNIERLVGSVFPVLRSLYAEAQWSALVRTFIQDHTCRSPYFLELGQEFLQFLMEEHAPRECDPPFMAELAHYEWVELALDVAEQEPLAQRDYEDILLARPQLSPVAWLLSYQFPVHRIGPNFQPSEAGEPTFLVVYRNRDDVVRFMELNAATARLVELTRDNISADGRSLLQTLASETGMDESAVLSFGADQLRQLVDADVLGLHVDDCTVDSRLAPIRQ
ncbi:MAG: putative DNA-binding domain-containing protein [Pseudomonadota bacterium]